jgi:hypothetical protein
VAMTRESCCSFGFRVSGNCAAAYMSCTEHADSASCNIHSECR